jgi:hypothetical protein
MQERLDDTIRRKWDVEERIASTMPTTDEGLALAAMVLLMWYEEFHGDGNDWKGDLERRPADALRRAGLGAVS